MSHPRIRTSRPRGFSYLETQVALVLFMMTLSGVAPLVVIQTRQLSQLEARFEPATTQYLVQPQGRWAMKLGAPAKLDDDPPEPSSPAGTPHHAKKMFLHSLDAPLEEDFIEVLVHVDF